MEPVPDLATKSIATTNEARDCLYACGQQLMTILAALPPTEARIAARELSEQLAAVAEDGGEPRFIAFEGIDGAGKSEQARRLWAALQAWPTREPTENHADEDGRPLAVLAASPHEAALLYAADRRRHQADIGRALSAGQAVVCDRYSLSMIAYQHASGCDLDWLIALDRGCRVPDLTIYLDLPVSEALARLDGKPGANHDEERLDAVSAAYRVAIERAQARGWRIAIVDARGTPNEVHDRILAVVRAPVAVTP